MKEGHLHPTPSTQHPTPIYFLPGPPRRASRRLLRHVCAVALALFLALSHSTALCNEADKCSFTVLYTAQSRGQIRSCDCNKFRYGGLGRAATYMRSVRELASDLVAVEGGDFLAKDSAEGRLRAEVFADYLKMMRYAAVVPGEREAVLPTDFLRQFDKDVGGIFVCANMLDAEGGKLLLRPYVVTKLPCGVRIGVIGVLDPLLLAPYGKLSNTPTLTDPSEALKKHLPEMRKQCDVALLIAHANSTRTEDLAAVARADFVIATHGAPRERPIAEGEMTVSKPTSKVAGAVFFECATQWSWSVGALDVTVNGGKVAKCANSLVYLGRAVKEDSAMVTVYNDYDAKLKKLAQERRDKMSERVRESLQARKPDNPNKAQD